MNFQFRFAWNAWSSPAFVPTDQRRSAGTTVSGSNDFLQLTQSYSATVLSKFTASALGCSARKDTFHFVFKRRYPYTVLRDRTCSEKDTNECSRLICDSSSCRTLSVGVQPCTTKVLPNTETFLPSGRICVTSVVPALCQIMYSLSVCSDGTTSAAPRSFRQNRPPARTLSLTYPATQAAKASFTAFLHHFRSQATKRTHCRTP